MPTVPLYPPNPDRQATASPLPQLLQTPLGLAILELQGTINIPPAEPGSTSTKIGKLVFPDYEAERDGNKEGGWMKKVWLYVGHQRMLGEVKKLPKALGVVGRKGILEKQGEDGGDDAMNLDTAVSSSGGDEQSKVEELEILEVVKWKIVFSSRPEPVGEGE